MKAISLWQPWASLIVAGFKLFETRHWPTNYRGELLIHAAKTKEGYKCFTPFEMTVIESLVGKDLTAMEISFGDFSDGRFAWLMHRPIKFQIPLPYKGSQGFFDVPEVTEGFIAAELLVNHFEVPDLVVRPE